MRILLVSLSDLFFVSLLLRTNRLQFLKIALHYDLLYVKMKAIIVVYPL